MIFSSIGFSAPSDANKIEQTPTSQATEQKHDEQNIVEINSASQKLANIKTEILEPRILPVYISAPGEVLPNLDQTILVTPRIQSQVVARLVNVGNHVKKGEPLVRLTSIEMSKAQADLLLSSKEWQRVKELGKQAIAAKRYETAEVTYQQSYSRLLAYGMENDQIIEFLKSDKPSKANGEYTLLSPRTGTIFTANFVDGQMIEPGTVLYKIVDEADLWVDAKLSNGDSEKIKKDADVVIQTAHHRLTGKVLQIHHQLEDTTRTRIARLVVSNTDDKLHPGEFVTCQIETEKTKPVLAVPSTALVRTADNDTAVYVEIKPDHFQAKEVKILETIGNWSVISGIDAGIKIVTDGVFFIHSESQKSGLSTHNH